MSTLGLHIFRGVLFYRQDLHLHLHLHGRGLHRHWHRYLHLRLHLHLRPYLQLYLHRQDLRVEGDRKKEKFLRNSHLEGVEYLEQVVA